MSRVLVSVALGFVLCAGSPVWGSEQGRTVPALVQGEGYGSPAPQTPPRAVPVAQSSTPVEPTPGVQVAHNLADAEIYEDCVKLFSQEDVNSWGLEWDVLKDTTKAFDDAGKRALLRFVLQKLKKNHDMSAYTLRGQIESFRDQMEEAHAQRLERLVQDYFSILFPSAQIKLEEKTGGVHLGCRAVITHTLEDAQSEMHTYHIKSHAKGRITERSSAAKLAHPTELFLYKLFERLGVGPEVHFFERENDTAHLYIATLDAGHEGEFYTFDKIHKDPSLRKRFIGALEGLYGDGVDTQDPQTLQTIEEKSQQDPVARHFIAQMSKLDLLFRIVSLDDLLTNPENWGLACRQDGSVHLRIIDFATKLKQRTGVIGERDFAGFSKGNGAYSPVKEDHRAVLHCLRRRDQSARVASAKEIMNSSFYHIEQCIDESYETILSLKKSGEILSTATEDSLKEMEDCCAGLKNGFSFFRDQLNEWAPQEDASGG